MHQAQAWDEITQNSDNRKFQECEDCEHFGQETIIILYILEVGLDFEIEL